jgi:endonuclease/exonuclease/phosphatase family metal-dependent hydrolase
VPVYLSAPGKVLVVREEPRAVVVAQLDTPDGPLTVANTHLSFVPGWNRHQLRRLRRDLAALPGPRVLMGDLNMAAPAPERPSGMRSLASAPTFPNVQPERQLDYVLTDADHVRVQSWETPAVPISDHRPLIIDARFGTGPDG